MSDILFQFLKISCAIIRIFTDMGILDDIFCNFSSFFFAFYIYYLYNVSFKIY